MRKLLKCLKIVLIVVVAATVMGYVTMRLWNWLMPEIFGLRLITFWQAIGLLLLSKLLLGGFHKHGPRGMGGRERWQRREWKRHMKERWSSMTPDERERFRVAMKEKWGRRCGPPWMQDRHEDWEPRGFRERNAEHPAEVKE